jgi:hypothetical protein
MGLNRKSLQRLSPDECGGDFDVGAMVAATLSTAIVSNTQSKKAFARLASEVIAEPRGSFEFVNYIVSCLAS